MIKRTVFVIVVLLLILGGFWFYDEFSVAPENIQIIEKKTKTTTPKPKKILDEKPEQRIVEHELDEDKNAKISNCSNLVSEYLDSHKGRALKRWQESLGLPAMDFSQKHSSPFLEHPYKYYQNSDLLVMAKNGDKLAMYAYGKNMIWKAFTGKELSPALTEAYTEPNVSEYFEKQALSEGQYWLYQAVLNGAVYVAYDLMDSYANELEYYQRNNQLTPELEKELEQMMFVYGELPEKLIKGLNENAYQSNPKSEWKDLFEQELERTVINYQQARVDLGLGEFVMQAPQEYLDLQNLCKKS